MIKIKNIKIILVSFTRMILNSMQKREHCLVEWEDSRWIVLTSFSFMFPSIFALFHRLYFYSGLLILTSFISANYWRKATDSWRRNLDLFFAKISFFVFLYNGIRFVRTPVYIMTGYPGLFLLVYFYYLSCKHFREKKNGWVKFHCMFHLFMMGEQMIILDSMIKLQCSQNL